MRTRTVITCAAAGFLFLAAGAYAAGSAEEEAGLLVYAYDSFVSEWGPGGQIVEAFENETGIEVTLQAAGDAGQVLSRLILEKDAPKADVVIGLDNNLLSRALDAEVLEPYRPSLLAVVDEELVFDETHHLTPYDYGHFAIVYDSEAITDPPGSLEDLTNPEYAGKLILMDPRTSSPGLGFLLWTTAVYGDDFAAYWKRLEPSILTITDGWDSGYGLFTNGEAPMVLSYTTSPAYHVEYEETTRYRAAVFENGHYLQIEGMGIVEGTKRREAAERFIEFMLGAEAQSILPLTNWMFPVNPEAALPESFEWAPKPETSYVLPSSRIAEMEDEWIDRWLETVSK